MNEFDIIAEYFKKPALHRQDVILGIGDDAACLRVPAGFDLLVSTDTLVSGVHFLEDWQPADIAWRSVMVNISDLAAMAAEPAWASLALTLPEHDETWLRSFSEGLHRSLGQFGVSLIGGDTTRGPLSITLTVHGLVPAGQAVFRSGAKPGDGIWLTGSLGAAAIAVHLLKARLPVPDGLMTSLLAPTPRLDMLPWLRAYASSAIDISDGLNADLHHVCKASGTGAILFEDCIPIEPLLKKIPDISALEFALQGGDDYELCFTVPARFEDAFTKAMTLSNIWCKRIGQMEKGSTIYLQGSSGLSVLNPAGYNHFQD